MALRLALPVLLVLLGALAAAEDRPASRPAQQTKTSPTPKGEDGAKEPARKEPAKAPRVWTLTALLQAFREVPGLEARFREERRLQLLEEPLVNEGTIHYAPPGLLARHVEKPARSSVVIAAAKLRAWDGRRVTALDLARYPVARQLLDGFLPLLRGDQKALEEHYALRFLARAEGRWELTLTPRKGPLSKALRSIAFLGRGLLLERMAMVEADGDETITTFSKVDLARRYGKADLARVFALPGDQREGKR